MRDLTAHAPGWCVNGGERVRTVGYMKAEPSWFKPVAVHLEPMDPARPDGSGLVDRHEEIEL